MTEQLMLISELSRRLDVPAHRIAYLFVTRKLVEPKLRLGNRRVFATGDCRRVAKALGKEWIAEERPAAKEAHE